jgi:pyruvate,water dikinase
VKGRTDADRMSGTSSYIRWFEDTSAPDISLVGGKNASLGELIRALRASGVRVPDGFSLTVDAYWRHLDHNDLSGSIRGHLAGLDDGTESLREAGAAIRASIREAELPPEVAEAVTLAYRELSTRGNGAASVAVRSSATAEDLPRASFAGQLESFLNIRGEDALLEACRRCFASLFTDRAITYRQLQGLEHLQVGLSVGVQRMVRSDLACSGVIFTIDTESGFPNLIVVSGAWGLGETVVQGTVRPDEYLVFKPVLRPGEPGERVVIDRRLGAKQHKLIYAGTGASEPTTLLETTSVERASFVLSDAELLELAAWAVAIEDHYGRPMDIEWAKDGETGELFVVQARPETVHASEETPAIREYTLAEHGPPLLEGLSIGQAMGVGPVRVIRSLDRADELQPGEILVTEMTSPDWVPVMNRAAGIVTDLGGRTSHAAIVSRELGVPAVVGTGFATAALSDGRAVTISCAEGPRGYVYDGRLDFQVRDVDIEHLPPTQTQIMSIIASPEAALRWWRLPVDGIGLARLEFTIASAIRVHPMALLRFQELTDLDARRQIEELTIGYPDKPEYFVDRLAVAIARIAASQYPRPVIVRTSDFKSNEYASLIGGRQFEVEEANPMLGLRGASRYYSDRYRDAFVLECLALRRVREQLGFRNVHLMIPFCRTVDEADRVIALLAEQHLERGRDGLELYLMCEIPSNVILAAEFAQRFDGFSIGSNDLTQLILGVDRDSAELQHLFDEGNPAVMEMIRSVIRTAHEHGAKVGLCGQAPSDRPEFAAFLTACGIDSISVNPDRVPDVRRVVAHAESAAPVG